MKYIPKTVYNEPFTLSMALSQVGRGWHGLVRECYQVCVENEVDISQIKEKWGGLRFYIQGGSEEVHDKIDDICARSVHICEACGKVGKLRTIGWHQTLCDGCYEK